MPHVAADAFAWIPAGVYGFCFLLGDELRPVRLQLELLKPELILNEHRIEDTIVIFGGARIPESTAANERLDAAETAYRENSSRFPA